MKHKKTFTIRTSCALLFTVAAPLCFTSCEVVDDYMNPSPVIRERDVDIYPKEGRTEAVERNYRPYAPFENKERNDTDQSSDNTSSGEKKKTNPTASTTNKSSSSSSTSTSSVNKSTASASSPSSSTKIEEPPKPKPKPKPKENVKYGKPVAGKKGYVTSPYAPTADPIYVGAYQPGTPVWCPHTNKIFLVP